MDSSTDLGYRLLRVAGRINRYANHHTDFAVPPAQVRLLALVQEMEPARVGQLAAADHSSQPTMTSQLNRTERAGWTRRATDPDDARAQVVRLTPEGRRQLAETRRLRGRAMAPAIAEWPAERQRRLAEAVALLEELMDDTAPENPNDRKES